MAILDDDVNEVKNVNEQEIKMDSYIKKIIWKCFRSSAKRT